MIRRDGVAQHRQGPRPADVLQGRRLQGELPEERRLLDVGGIRVPLVEISLRDQEASPSLIPFEDAGVTGPEQLRIQALPDRPLDLLLGRPDVPQEDRLAVGIVAQRLALEIDVDAAGQGVGHHQHGGGQVVGAHQRMDAGLEVAVAAQDGDGHQVVLPDGPGDGLRQWTAVADTGGAAEAHQVEAQGLQIRQEVRPAQVIHHHRRARGQAGLHIRLHHQPPLHRVAGQQPRPDHHRGVGGVGAGGDGRDDHGSMPQGHHLAVQAHPRGRRGRSSRGRRRWRGRPPFPFQPADRMNVRGVRGGQHRGDALPELLLDRSQRDPIVRPPRAGQGGLNRPQIQLQHIGVNRIRPLAVIEQALGPGVALHQVHLLRIPAGAPQIRQRLLVHREEPAGCPILRGHIGDGRPIRQAEAPQAGSEELHEFIHHPPLAEELGDREDQVGGGGALGETARQANADHLRDAHIVRLAQHHRFGLDAAHAPAQHPQGVDHRRVGIRAHQGVREGHRLPIHLAGLDHLRQVFQVHLVDDAGAGGDHPEVPEGLLGPAQQRIALPVALELLFHIQVKGQLRPEEIHLDGVVDHQIGGDQGVDPPGIPAEALHRRAHRREIHHRGDAGEVLEDHPGGHEGDLPIGEILGSPAGEGQDILLGHQAAIAVPEEVFQKDPDGERQTGGIAHALFRQPAEPVIDNRPGRGFQRRLRAEGIESRHRCTASPSSSLEAKAMAIVTHRARCAKGQEEENPAARLPTLEPERFPLTGAQPSVILCPAKYFS
ncbi:hypothetical protein HRbin22_02093 [Candidatus Thermoflexus japonica]|uniref:Uncharacterized protein n=1 Tax=Candidatus Thermoflexus japonica TaxID=2035417 RepID=A0A2H5Y8S3_9CHLR|nr:hypothetical protein HRbin22_02093 [Candidatus Thermoflexus japonica]